MNGSRSTSAVLQRWSEIDFSRAPCRCESKNNSGQERECESETEHAPIESRLECGQAAAAPKADRDQTVFDPDCEDNPEETAEHREQYALSQQLSDESPTTGAESQS